MAKAAPRVRMRPRGAAPCVPGPSRSNHFRINGRFGTCENGQTIRSTSLHRVASAAISALPLPDSRAGMATDGLSSQNQGEWSNILVAALGNGVDSYRRPIACNVLIRAQCRQSFFWLPSMQRSQTDRARFLLRETAKAPHFKNRQAFPNMSSRQSPRFARLNVSNGCSSIEMW